MLLPPATSHLVSALRAPSTLALVGLCLAATAAWLAWRRAQVEPTPEELEQERREFLSAIGRITDGTILETYWADDPAADTPHTLLYQYRIGGVTYECAQDVHLLAEHLRHIRIDLPIQVRFDPRNPADSLVVAEAWSGLRPNLHDPLTAPTHPPHPPSN